MADGRATRAPDSPTPAPDGAAAGHGAGSGDRYRPDLGLYVVDGGQRLTPLQQRLYDRGVALPCGRSYLDNDHTNEILRGLDKVPGQHLVAAYGDENGVGIRDRRDRLSVVGADDYGAMLANDDTWNGTDDLLLLSSDAGKGLAQQLYDGFHREVTIIAPVGHVVVYEDGRIAAGHFDGPGSDGNLTFSEEPDAWVVLRRHEPAAAPGTGSW